MWTSLSRNTGAWRPLSPGPTAARRWEALFWRLSPRFTPGDFLVVLPEHLGEITQSHGHTAGDQRQDRDHRHHRNPQRARAGQLVVTAGIEFGWLAAGVGGVRHGTFQGKARRRIRGRAHARGDVALGDVALGDVALGDSGGRGTPRHASGGTDRKSVV